jgi:hypothetical protein
MKSSSSRRLAIFAGLLLCGCASTQLNYNTLDIASTTDSLLTQQILYNFASFLDNEAAIPAQVSISSGTASTSNALTPNFNTPLDTGITTTRTVVTAAANSTTNTQAGATASKTAGLSASDSWNQSWSYAPVTDPDRMRRLQALYRYAVEWSSEGSSGVQKFVDNFPPIYKSVSYSKPLCLRGIHREAQTRAPVTSNEDSKIQSTPGTPPKGADPIEVCATAAGTTTSLQHGATTKSFSSQVPDEHYLTTEFCVLCYGRNGKTINQNLRGDWLHWDNVSGRPVWPNRARHPGDISLGRFGRYEFFVSADNAQKFVTFTAAVLLATNVSGSAGATSASASGGQGSGAPKALTFFDLNGNAFQLFIGQ